MKHWCACDRRWGTREGIVKRRQKKATKAKKILEQMLKMKEKNVTHVVRPTSGVLTTVCKTSINRRLRQEFPLILK